MNKRIVSRLHSFGRRFDFHKTYLSTHSPQDDGTRVRSRIVIVGGGSGGISTAARLSTRRKYDEILLVEPNDTHYYQPLWTLVGGGIRDFADSGRPMHSVIPQNVKWEKHAVASFNPDFNSIKLSNDVEVTYDYLVVAMGIRLAFEKIKGLPEAFEFPGVCSNYSPLTVQKTTEAIRNFKSGHAVFTQPVNPIKCGGAPQKIMYLADEYFKKNNLTGNTKVSFFTALPMIFVSPHYSKALKAIAESKDILLNFDHNLVEVKPESKIAVFLEKDGTQVDVPYEILHVTPPMVAPSPIQDSPLCDPSGFLDVDKHTLQHKKYPNVFGIGDCTNVPTSKTAAAVAGQCGVLTKNLIHAIEQKPLEAKYDGYTSCPLVTGFSKGIIAEFDFELKPMETFPIDQSVERYLSYLVKTDVLPLLYWEVFLKGRWTGPSTLRKLLHLGMGHR